MKQEENRPVFRTGLSVEDRETIDLYGAIRGRVFHAPFVSSGQGRPRKYHGNHQDHS